MSSLETKIQSIHFRPDEQRQTILITNQNNCQRCQPKPCITICPTGVFFWSQQPVDPILVSYKQCIECGACRLACPEKNIEFSYPCSGYGVLFSRG